MKRLLIPALCFPLFLLASAGGLSAQNNPANPPSAPVPASTPAPADTPPPPKRSRVVLVERPSVVNKFAVDVPAVGQMWNDALLQYTGKATAAAAWRSLGIVPNDTVGIKISTDGSEIMSSRVALVDAIAYTLTQAGVSIDHIIVWDRDDEDLMGTPYKTLAHPYQVDSVIPETGFDSKLFYVNEIVGKLIWGDLLFQGKAADLIKQAEDSVAKKVKDEGGNPADLPKDEIREQTSNRSYFAKLVTQTCTKIVNVPVVIDSDGVGLNGCLANLALGSIDNSRRFLDPDVHGDPAIGEILDHDVFHKKVVLNVMDGLIAQYAGGPAFAPQFTQSIGALYVSTDPVAIDSLVLPRVSAWRDEAKVVPFGNLASHIHAAAQQGLGNDDPKLIDLIKVQ